MSQSSLVIAVVLKLNVYHKQQKTVSHFQYGLLAVLPLLPFLPHSLLPLSLPPILFPSPPCYHLPVFCNLPLKPDVALGEGTHLLDHPSEPSMLLTNLQQTHRNTTHSDEK